MKEGGWYGWIHLRKLEFARFIECVTGYHRTLTTYLNTLLSNGFIINHIVEPQPPENMMDIPGMQDEMRRPMMLIVSANKQVDR